VKLGTNVMPWDVTASSYFFFFFPAVNSVAFALFHAVWQNGQL